MGTSSSSLEQLSVGGLTVGIFAIFIGVIASLVWQSGVHKRLMIMFSIPTSIALLVHYILQLEDVSNYLRIDGISFGQTFWVLMMVWTLMDGICLSLVLYISKVVGGFLALEGAGAAFLFFVAGRASDFGVRWNFFSFGVIAVFIHILIAALASRTYRKKNFDENGTELDTPLEYRNGEYVMVILTHILFAVVFFGAILVFGLGPEGKHEISLARRNLGNFVLSLGMIGSHVVKIANFRDHSVRSE